jgi:phosphomannomutase
MSKAIIGYLTPGDPNNAEECRRVKKRMEEAFIGADGFEKVERVDYTDGIRIFFDNGEICHLRPSGNAPEFRVYAIADSPERAREMVKMCTDKVIPGLAGNVSGSLKQP